MFIMIILLIKYQSIQEAIKIIKKTNNFLISHHFRLTTGYAQFIQLKKSVTYFFYFQMDTSFLYLFACQNQNFRILDYFILMKQKLHIVIKEIYKKICQNLLMIIRLKIMIKRCNYLIYNLIVKFQVVLINRNLLLKNKILSISQTLLH